jgi:hypothetical protein
VVNTETRLDEGSAERMERLMPPTSTRAVGGPLLLVLALLSAVAPFATDLYLSAFPLMTTALGASATSIQLTLTAFLVGIALGQLVFGPLSDRFGRMTPLVVGSLLCLVASAATALAPTVDLLVAARFVQGRHRRGGHGHRQGDHRRPSDRCGRREGLQHDDARRWRGTRRRTGAR